MNLNLLCTCDDSMWMCQFAIGGEVLDEILTDITLSEHEQIARQVSEVATIHVGMAERAMADGRLDWEARIVCPTCGGGTVFNAHGMHDVVGVKP